jgi:hypothetical protein
MKLNRLTPCQRIEIWQPRWKDRTVMIATYKVGTHNEICFTKTKSLPDSYYISGAEIRNYPIESNGKVQCYCVPLDKLELLERETR